MDEEAFFTEEGMCSRPGGEASPAVVGLLGSALSEVEASVFAGEDGGQRGGGGVLRLRMDCSVF